MESLQVTSISESGQREYNVLFIIDEVDFVEHLGISILSSIAKEVGWKTSLLVSNKNVLDNFFQTTKPELVCYSAMSSNFDFYNETNKYLKSKYNFISLLGGPHPTFFPDVIKEEGIDYICTGEGEGAFRDFLTNLKKGEDLEHIENISSKVNKNPERGLIQDLDEIPMPD